MKTYKLRDEILYSIKDPECLTIISTRDEDNWYFKVEGLMTSREFSYHYQD